MYRKPIIITNDSLFEGVYADSGDITSGDCWTVTVTRDQPDAGGYSTWRVDARHSSSVVHISKKTVVTVVFSGPVTSAEFEGFIATVNGNVVTLTRESHANAYQAGDNFNSLLKIWAPNYNSISVISKSITCTHAPNVQGGYD